MNRRQRGFTLLEALIALAIVAIGLTAALRASGVGTEGVIEHRSRLLALWLAQDVAAERTARGDWPAPGDSSSEAEMAGQRFLVRQAVKDTPNPRFRRIEISVASPAEPERALRRLAAFVTAPN